MNILNLIKKDFKTGERVIILHSDCNMYFGSLIRMDENEIVIGSKEYDWDDVVFLGHDGFPCRAFKSTLSMEQFEDLESWEVMYALYRSMGLDLSGVDTTKAFSKQPKVLKNSKTPTSTPPARIYGCGGGCPYEIEEVSACIINPFNGLSRNTEETLYMESEDGAKGMWWNLEYELFEICV